MHVSIRELLWPPGKCGLSRRRPGQRCQVQTGPPALRAGAAQEEVCSEDDQKEGSRWQILQEIKEEFKMGTRCNSREGSSPASEALAS